MDQTQFPAYLAIALNAVAVFFVVHGYFRRLATKDDIKDLNDRLGNVEARQGALESGFENLEGAVRENGKKVDASLELHNTVHVDMKVLQASVNRLDSYFETPKLKSS